MNKTFIVSVVVIFVLANLFGFLVHGLVLNADYTRLATEGIFRTPAEAQPLRPYMIAANLSMAIGFTWIYRMGRESKPWLGQGTRFGIAVALLTCIPWFLIYYVVTPMPSDLVAKQIVLEGITTVVMGIVTAFINRDTIPARA